MMLDNIAVTTFNSMDQNPIRPNSTGIAMAIGTTAQKPAPGERKAMPTNKKTSARDRERLTS